MDSRDYESFLQQVEGDREMRANVNLYRAPGAPAAVAMDEEDLDEEEVRLDELLDSLVLDDADAPADGADASAEAPPRPPPARTVSATPFAFKPPSWESGS